MGLCTPMLIKGISVLKFWRKMCDFCLQSGVRTFAFIIFWVRGPWFVLRTHHCALVIRTTMPQSSLAELSHSLIDSLELNYQLPPSDTVQLNFSMP